MIKLRPIKHSLYAKSAQYLALKEEFRIAWNKSIVIENIKYDMPEVHVNSCNRLVKLISSHMYVHAACWCGWYYNSFVPFSHYRDGRHFADDIFTCIFVNENCCILIKLPLKYARKGPIDNYPELVQIMAWRRSGDKPLSEPMMVILLTHICVTLPQ